MLSGCYGKGDGIQIVRTPGSAETGSIGGVAIGKCRRKLICDEDNEGCEAQAKSKLASLTPSGRLRDGIDVATLGTMSALRSTSGIFAKAASAEGTALKGGSTLASEAAGTAKIGNAARETTTVIGRVKDLQTMGPSEKSLLDRLPNLGNSKANWHQNAGILREEMQRGLPIRDASPGDTAGQFLNAERNLLRNHGWTFEPQTNYWMPPMP